MSSHLNCQGIPILAGASFSEIKAGKKLNATVRATGSRQCHKLMRLGSFVSCGLRQRADLDLEAELFDLGGQAPGFDLGGTAIEVVGTEVVVFGTIF
jgi:hypothetical protein